MRCKSKNRSKINEFNFDPMAVTWLEDYNGFITKIWNRVPQRLGKCIASLAVFLLGISINGDWLNLSIHISRQLGYVTHIDSTYDLSEISLQSLKLQNILTFWLSSCAVSYSMYFVVGGFLHWYYYVRQRDKAEQWKCQPRKWLSPELERHEIILGSTTLFLNATASAFLACYITNGGYNKVYYQISDYGWMWFFLQFAVIFIYQDYCTYWLHRIYHFPYLYKRFHKLHHKYKQPTAFSVTAIHPVESLNIQMILILPLFIVPLHWFPFYTVALYIYYHGIIDHSGINFKSYWWQPWQPDAIFHDNHHQYFHVNFAFNIELWDKIHGTYRRKDRVYREDIFYGKGKSMDQLSASELKEDIQERNSENPFAYRRNKLEYKLNSDELKKIMQ